uniref:Uncharacterized protein n=1 Tax=Clastoptera arizonana TaxID=38151 RepID=A0A1B6C7E9_9HEMI
MKIKEDTTSREHLDPKVLDKGSCLISEIDRSLIKAVSGIQPINKNSLPFTNPRDSDEFSNSSNGSVNELNSVDCNESAGDLSATMSAKETVMYSNYESSDSDEEKIKTYVMNKNTDPNTENDLTAQLNKLSLSGEHVQKFDNDKKNDISRKIVTKLNICDELSERMCNLTVLEDKADKNEDGLDQLCPRGPIYSNKTYTNARFASQNYYDKSKTHSSSEIELPGLGKVPVCEFEDFLVKELDELSEIECVSSNDTLNISEQWEDPQESLFKENDLNDLINTTLDKHSSNEVSRKSSLVVNNFSEDFENPSPSNYGSLTPSSSFNETSMSPCSSLNSEISGIGCRSCENSMQQSQFTQPHIKSSYENIPYSEDSNSLSQMGYQLCNSYSYNSYVGAVLSDYVQSSKDTTISSSILEKIKSGKVERRYNEIYITILKKCQNDINKYEYDAGKVKMLLLNLIKPGRNGNDLDWFLNLYGVIKFLKSAKDKFISHENIKDILTGKLYDQKSLLCLVRKNHPDLPIAAGYITKELVKLGFSSGQENIL